MQLSNLLLLAGSASAGVILGDVAGIARGEVDVAGGLKPRGAATHDLGTPLDDGQNGCTHKYLQVGTVYYQNYCPGYVGGVQLGSGRSDSYMNCLTDCNNSPVCQTVLYTPGTCGFYGSGYSPSQASYVPKSVYVAIKLKGLPSSCSSSSKTKTTPVATVSNVAAPVGPVCASGPTTLNGRKCNRMCSTDRVGGDYKSFPATSFAACSAACAADSLCTTAQFSEFFRYCYLKNAKGSATSTMGVHTIDCNPLTNSWTPTETKNTTTPAVCTNVSLPVNKRLCTVRCGMDRVGGEYTWSKSDTFAMCIQACASDSKCVSAQYTADSKLCYMKSKANALVANAMVTTVDCDRAPSDKASSPWTVNKRLTAKRSTI